MRPRLSIHVCCLLGLAIAGPAPAATKTATLGVQVVVTTACSVGNDAAGGAVDFGTLDFGHHLDLVASIVANGGQNSGGVRVHCANGVPYRVLMGGGGSGNVAARRMTGPGGVQVGYNLYTGSDLATVWDDTVGVAAIGNGQDQWLPVYGRVPTQPTPAAGTYSDVVIVTVSW